MDTAMDLTFIGRNMSPIVPAAFDNASYNATDHQDLTKIPYPGNVVKDVATWEMVTKILFYCIIMVLSLVGNVMIVYIVWKNKRMRTTTNYYIVNLAIADLLVTVTCTWVHLVDDLTENWILGAFFCKFNTFAQVLSLVSSILTLTVIACDRFFGIVFAMKAHMTDRRAWVSILLIWICSGGIAAPLLFYREQQSRHWLNHVEIWCDDIWPTVSYQDPFTNATITTTPSRIFYYTFISLVLFFFPILIMSIAYSLIIWRLWSNRLPGEQIASEVLAQDKVKKKVVVMLMVILSVFALCWFPFQIYILYAEHRADRSSKYSPWFYHFRYFATFIAYSNSAFNPIIYAGFNENFKRGFKDAISCGRMRRRYCAMEMRTDSYHSTTMVSRV